MSRVCCAVAAAVLLLLAAIGYKVVFLGSTQASGDGRTAILLVPAERELVLAEMRAFLAAVQGVTAAAAAGDATAIAAAARTVGSAAAQGVPITLLAKLPMGFKTMGLATHRAFDTIALDAEQLGDPGHSLEQLGALLGNCVGCHAAFRIEATPVP